MEEFATKVSIAIEEWKDLPPSKRWTSRRLRALRNLTHGLDKYTLIQVDFLTSLRSMSKAVAQEIERAQRGY